MKEFLNFIFAMILMVFRFALPFIIATPTMLITVYLLYDSGLPDIWLGILPGIFGVLSFYLFLKLLNFIFNKEKHKDD